MTCPFKGFHLKLVSRNVQMRAAIYLYIRAWAASGRGPLLSSFSSIAHCHFVQRHKAARYQLRTLGGGRRPPSICPSKWIHPPSLPSAMTQAGWDQPRRHATSWHRTRKMTRHVGRLPTDKHISINMTWLQGLDLKSGWTCGTRWKHGCNFSCLTSDFNNHELLVMTILKFTFFMNNQVQISHCMNYTLSVSLALAWHNISCSPVCFLNLSIYRA